MKEIYDRVIEHPQFHELTKRRNRFSVLLSVIVLAVFYTFVAIAATQPALFSSPLSEGTTWCLGLVAGFVIQGFAFLMTGVYVRRANGEFDALNRAIIEEVR
jgi:uncharacterized membrane protein (DUF485 family)